MEKFDLIYMDNAYWISKWIECPYGKVLQIDNSQEHNGFESKEDAFSRLMYLGDKVKAQRNIEMTKEPKKQVDVVISSEETLDHLITITGDVYIHSGATLNASNLKVVIGDLNVNPKATLNAKKLNTVTGKLHGISSDR